MTHAFLYAFSCGIVMISKEKVYCLDMPGQGTSQNCHLRQFTNLPNTLPAIKAVQ